MNVLVFNDTFDALSETFIQKQIACLQHEHRVFLAGFNVKFNGSLNTKTCVVSAIPINLFDRIKTKLCRILPGNNPYNLPVSSQKKLEKFCIENNIQFIHAHYGINAVRILPLIKKNKLPLLVSFHGYDASKLIKNKIYCNGLKAVFSSNFVTVSFCSKHMFPVLNKFGLKKEKAFHIPYGIDLKMFSQEIPERKNSKLIILHAGRLTPKKGVHDLLLVFSKIIKKYNVELRIVGDGEQKDELMNLINTLDIKMHVNFIGPLSHSNTILEMQHADIFVLNSQTAKDGDMEGFPNVILEAMANGCAVVSTIHAGIPDAIEHNVDGILIKEKDNNNLEEAVIRLITDENLRRELAKNAFEKRLQFSVEKMCKALNLIVNTKF